MTTQHLPIAPPVAAANDESRVPVPSGYKDGVRYRERVAGTGYGRSSGYARGRQYADPRGEPIFRCG